MALAQDTNQRVLELFAPTAAGAFGEQFGPFAAQVAQRGPCTVEPVRIDGFLAPLACQIGGRNLRADLGDVVVEFNQPSLVIRQAGADHSHRGCVVQVSHRNILR